MSALLHLGHGIILSGFFKLSVVFSSDVVVVVVISLFSDVPFDSSLRSDDL